MTIPRFYLPNLRSGEQFSLSAEDSKHAVGVLRMRKGDRLVLFDGKGVQATGVIVGDGRSQVVVLIEASQAICREVPKHLEMVVALPKGDRQKQLIDMLVQLGVHSLTPLVCTRSVAQPTSNALERLRRGVIESCKQCGRNQLMDVQPPQSLPELVETNSIDAINAVRLFAHPYGSATSLPTAFEDFVSKSDSKAQVMVGPEGGFTEDEVQQLNDNHWRQIHLGRRILRIETAAIAVASAWMMQHETMSP